MNKKKLKIKMPIIIFYLRYLFNDDNPKSTILVQKILKYYEEHKLIVGSWINELCNQSGDYNIITLLASGKEVVIYE